MDVMALISFPGEIRLLTIQDPARRDTFPKVDWKAVNRVQKELSKAILVLENAGNAQMPRTHFPSDQQVLLTVLVRD